MPSSAPSPCPFCGRTENVQRETLNGLVIWCYHCGAQGPTCDDPGEASPVRWLEAWRSWRARRGAPRALVAATRV